MIFGILVISCGRTFGDLFAVLKNHDPLGRVHDDLHDVLDPQNGDGKLFLGAPDHLQGPGCLRRVQAGHDFIQQQAASGWWPGPGPVPASAIHRGSNRGPGCPVWRRAPRIPDSRRPPGRHRERLMLGRFFPFKTPTSHPGQGGHGFEGLGDLIGPGDAQPADSGWRAGR